MSFNGRPNMFFGKIISCTCDLHLKLNILNPLNIIFLSNGFKHESFAFNLFLQNFKTLKFLYDLIFHQVHRKGHAFVVQKIENQLYDLMNSF
jgi:hypothetical protein